MLTFETDHLLGTVSIVEKLQVRLILRMAGRSSNHIITQSFPFQKVAHKIDTLDAQPSNESDGILILVTGALLVCPT